MLLAIIAVFLATGTAHTETNMFGCFMRTYDKAHLAKHPDQLVTGVRLHIYPAPPETGSAATWLKIEARVRGRDVTLTNSAVCREGEPSIRPKYFPPDAKWCFVECDGGGVGVASRGDHIMMYLSEILMDVKRDYATCSAERESPTLSFYRQTKTTTYLGSIASTSATARIWSDNDRPPLHARRRCAVSGNRGSARWHAALLQMRRH